MPLILATLLIPLIATGAVIIPPATAAAPYRQPQAAASERLTAIAFGSRNTVLVAVSSDGARTFRRPVVVANGATVSQPGVLSLGRRRGPRVAITNNTIVVSAVYGAKGGGVDGNLFAWRSTDGGSTWSAGARVNDAADAAREGLHAMASGGGVVFTAWLDLRSQGTKIFGASSRDGGATWSRNVLVYESPAGTVCECCHPSVAIDAQGNIHVMFRNAIEGSRDLYVTRSTDGGKSFAAAAKLGSGTWKIEACPMDGGSLAVSATESPITVWRRDKDLYSARDGSAEERLGPGKDPAIALTSKGRYIGWASGSGVQFTLPGRSDPMSLDENGAFLHLTSTPLGHVVATWERTGSIVVERFD